jgi:hypothetical protein
MPIYNMTFNCLSGWKKAALLTNCRSNPWLRSLTGIFGLLVKLLLIDKGACAAALGLSGFGFLCLFVGCVARKKTQGY